MSDDTFILIGTIPWILFALLVYSLSLKIKNPKAFKILFWGSLIFAAIRYGIGYDYYGYNSVIEGRQPDYVLERWEPLSQYLARFCMNIGNSQLFFIVTSILSLLPIYIVTKKLSISSEFSFGIYLLFPMFFLESIGVIRNGVAYSISLLTYYFLYRKKIVYALLFFVISIGFHMSSIITILLFPLYYIVHNKNFNRIAYIASLLGSAFIIPIISTFFSTGELGLLFLNKLENESKGGAIMTILVNIIGVFNLLNWEKLSSFSKSNVIYLTYINFGIILWNLFLPINQTTALRFSTFFMLYLILLLPSFPIVFNSKFSRKMIMNFILLLFASSFFLALKSRFFDNEKGHIANIPYQVFFLDPDDRFDYSK